MFLFLKIILAHLIADYVLQFEELYRLKVRSFLGQLFHALIHGAVTALLIFPYLTDPFILLFIVALVAEHLAQDLLKYGLTKKFPGNTFLYYIGDQALHILVLSAIFIFPVAHEVRGFPGDVLLDMLYRSNTVTIALIFFILLTFAGNYTLHAFYQNRVKGARPLHWISSPEMVWTIIERSAIAAAVFFTSNPFWLFTALAIGLPRFFVPVLRHRTDFLVSVTYALALSILFKSLIP